MVFLRNYSNVSMLGVGIFLTFLMRLSSLLLSDPLNDYSDCINNINTYYNYVNAILDNNYVILLIPYEYVI